jgi:hypothetical protein
VTVGLRRAFSVTSGLRRDACTIRHKRLLRSDV